MARCRNLCINIKYTVILEFVGVAGKNLELTEGITDFVSNNARELALSFSKVLAGKEVPTQYQTPAEDKDIA